MLCNERGTLLVDLGEIVTHELTTFPKKIYKTYLRE